jgi:hypothetical protein
VILRNIIGRTDFTCVRMQSVQQTNVANGSSTTTTTSEHLLLLMVTYVWHLCAASTTSTRTLPVEERTETCDADDGDAMQRDDESRAHNAAASFGLASMWRAENAQTQTPGTPAQTPATHTASASRSHLSATTATARTHSFLTSTPVSNRLTQQVTLRQL